MSIKLTPKKAIIEFCKECVCGDREEIRLCTAKNCPLYSFRPYKTRGEKGTSTDVNEGNATETKRTRKTLSEDHKAKLKAGREARKNASKAQKIPKATKAKKTAKRVSGKVDGRSKAMTAEKKAAMKAGRERARAARMMM